MKSIVPETGIRSGGIFPGDMTGASGNCDSILCVCSPPSARNEDDADEEADTCWADNSGIPGHVDSSLLLDRSPSTSINPLEIQLSTFVCSGDMLSRSGYSVPETWQLHPTTKMNYHLVMKRFIYNIYNWFRFETILQPSKSIAVHIYRTQIQKRTQDRLLGLELQG